ncbi:proline oxidase [Nannizzia gypsea CBS 118893]|uniref:Proline dehydrogenase n=1 Tax=Arthroderma gypseum (strain ATCC MYA-4604 / CBS 118893) TaxID=535722 RepID=E4V0C4_ARTGP|nr:proline oxidase [Nannizzia gypsea CBS 118893]EFR03061.1 proline oxidase [Nannizzia gypsea CBS 118893]
MASVGGIPTVNIVWTTKQHLYFHPRAARLIIGSKCRPAHQIFNWARYHHGEKHIGGHRDKLPSPPTSTALATPGRQRTAASLFQPTSPPLSSFSSSPCQTAAPPLSMLSISSITRSLLTTAMSSSPVLLKAAMKVLSFIADSKSPLLNPDRNLILNYLLRKTIYTQFCAGEKPHEVQRCIDEIRRAGFSGVILGYAREGVPDENETAAILELDSKCSNSAESNKKVAEYEVSAWREGNLHTIDLAGEGGFVNLKFTGAGSEAIKYLLRGVPPPPLLHEAINEICERAMARNVRLLIDAEHQAVQPAIDAWALDLQRKYNIRSDSTAGERAVVYNTYQAYLRSTPKTLSQHMAMAQDEGFVLGVKLVRGAYLGVEPRHFIWDLKEETDTAYDGLADALIRREYNDVLTPYVSTAAPESPTSPPVTEPESMPKPTFPEVDLLVASHNRYSIKKAQDIRNEQSYIGQPQIGLMYGQIYGMADELSCELIHRGKICHEDEIVDTSMLVKPMVYKAVVWGSVRECMRYLVRRGQENMDAASRTLDTRRAMAKELRRRIFGTRF